MGLHWRTRIISPNVAASRKPAGNKCAWSRQSSPPGKPRDLPVADFYADWATAESAAKPVLPPRPFSPGSTAISRPLPGWNRGPGVIGVSRQPWATAASRYRFVDEFAAIRPRVQGAGNLERFDWWLNTFRVTKTMGQLGFARGELDAIIERIEKEDNPQTRRRLAREQALPGLPADADAVG